MPNLNRSRICGPATKPSAAPMRPITGLNLLSDLAEYHPVLCGTVPIGVDVEGSDLDMIMEAHDVDRYKDEIERLYGGLEGFRIREKTVKGVPTVIAGFRYRSFDFELFAQPVPVEEQDAYRHMLVEHHVVETRPQIREDTPSKSSFRLNCKWKAAGVLISGRNLTIYIPEGIFGSTGCEQGQTRTKVGGAKPRV